MVKGAKSKLIESADKDLPDFDFQRLVRTRCSRYQVEPTLKAKHIDTKLEAFIGENDLLPVSFLHEGAEIAKAVGKITFVERSMEGFGTGFLIGPDMIMTNNHVISNHEVASKAFIEFNYEFDENGNPLQEARYSLDPDRLFITEEGLDFSIVGVRGRPGDQFGWIPLLKDPLVITRHERVYIIQHPQGRRKEVGIHDNKIQRVLTHLLRYTTDTEPGSSGSPCFNKDWKLIGLHHSKGERDSKTNKYTNNEAVRISSIARYLEYQGTSKRDNAAIEMLKYTAGENPYEGFFGSCGLIGPKSNWEDIVTGYRGEEDFLDLGFWNISDLNDSTPKQKISRIAKTILDFSLDLVGFTDVTRIALETLVNEMVKVGGEYSFVFEDTGKEQSIGVFYNTNTVDARLENWDGSVLKELSKIGGTDSYRNPLKVVASIKSDTSDFSFKFIVVSSRDGQRLNISEISPEITRNLADTWSSAIEKDAVDDKRDYIIGGDFSGIPNVYNAFVSKLNTTAITERRKEGEENIFVKGQSSRIEQMFFTKNATIRYDSGTTPISKSEKNMPEDIMEIDEHLPVIMRIKIGKSTSRKETVSDTQKRTMEIKIPRDVDDIHLDLSR